MEAPVASVQTSASTPSSEEAESSVSSEEPLSSGPSSIILPDVEPGLSSQNPIYDQPKEDGGAGLLYGILAWVFIGLAIVIILVVMFSNAKTERTTHSSGRTYAKRRGSFRKKHLLDDKYYRNLKRK